MQKAKRGTGLLRCLSTLGVPIVGSNRMALVELDPSEGCQTKILKNLDWAVDALLPLLLLSAPTHPHTFTHTIKAFTSSRVGSLRSHTFPFPILFLGSL